MSPDILDFPTSADIIVDEGSDVTLRCVARGSPEPTILWKREDGQMIPTRLGTESKYLTLKLYKKRLYNLELAHCLTKLVLTSVK